MKPTAASVMRFLHQFANRRPGARAKAREPGTHAHRAGNFAIRVHGFRVRRFAGPGTTRSGDVGVSRPFRCEPAIFEGLFLPESHANMPSRPGRWNCFRSDKL